MVYQEYFYCFISDISSVLFYFIKITMSCFSETSMINLSSKQYYFPHPGKFSLYSSNTGHFNCETLIHLNLGFKKSLFPFRFLNPGCKSHLIKLNMLLGYFIFFAVCQFVRAGFYFKWWKLILWQTINFFSDFRCLNQESHT